LSTVCLSMYSITENIYYSQLFSVAILLQPEPVSHRITQGNDCVLSPYVLSSCGLPLPPTCLLLAANEARSYFASTIHAQDFQWMKVRHVVCPFKQRQESISTTVSLHHNTPTENDVSQFTSYCKNVNHKERNFKSDTATLQIIPLHAMFK
jgi:hypothetical protein